MKALFIAVFATFIFALIIIYHDSQGANAKLSDNTKIIVLNGTIIQISE